MYMTDSRDGEQQYGTPHPSRVRRSALLPCAFSHEPRWDSGSRRVRWEGRPTPAARVGLEPDGSRGRKIIERTSMGGLEPPTPAFGEVPNTAMGDFLGGYAVTLADTA